MLGKPAASLSSGLLARKGHARPAMRPQGYMQMTPNGQEDLGWNDMGDEEMYPQVQFEPTPVVAPIAGPAVAPIAGPVPAPPVLRQRAELEEQIAQPQATDDYDDFGDEHDETAELEQPVEVQEAFAPEPVIPPAPVVRPAPAPVSAGTLARVAREMKAGKAKAAFTLRLDTDRHLRLRLASAVCNRSAQHLVTEALDAFLESLTEVDALARQLGDHEICRSGE